jgi:hypothetical protein
MVTLGVVGGCPRSVLVIDQPLRQVVRVSCGTPLPRNKSIAPQWASSEDQLAVRYDDASQLHIHEVTAPRLHSSASSIAQAHTTRAARVVVTSLTKKYRYALAALMIG